MAYNVTITYKGPVTDSITFVNPICRMFEPCKSYTDTTAYKGTVYDTNVDGFGKIDLMEPYASTSFPFPVPLTQFKLAVIGKDVKDKNDNVIGKSITFTINSYMEAFWYKQAGVALADQGFKVEVEETEVSETLNT